MRISGNRSPPAGAGAASHGAVGSPRRAGASGAGERAGVAAAPPAGALLSACSFASVGMGLPLA